MYKLAIIITLAVFTMMSAVLMTYDFTVVDTVVMEPVEYCSATEIFHCYKILE